jgi:hypothetical protein
MPQPLEERKCPACGGKNLISGKLSPYLSPYKRNCNFIPDGRFMMMGYIVTPSVCLDCGFLAQYLYKTDVDEIRRRA